MVSRFADAAYLVRGRINPLHCTQMGQPIQSDPDLDVSSVVLVRLQLDILDALLAEAQSLAGSSALPLFQPADATLLDQLD